MERRVAHPIRTLRRGRASGEDARTPRGAPSRRLCGAGRAFDRHHQGAQAVSQLLAGGLSAPGRSPAPPEGVLLRRARPRAPTRSPRAGATGSCPSRGIGQGWVYVLIGKESKDEGKISVSGDMSICLARECPFGLVYLGIRAGVGASKRSSIGKYKESRNEVPEYHKKCLYISHLLSLCCKRIVTFDI
jgi:hypothetical protein